MDPFMAAQQGLVHTSYAQPMTYTTQAMPFTTGYNYVDPYSGGGGQALVSHGYEMQHQYVDDGSTGLLASGDVEATASSVDPDQTIIASVSTLDDFLAPDETTVSPAEETSSQVSAATSETSVSMVIAFSKFFSSMMAALINNMKSLTCPGNFSS